jgi:hypothetical protein
LAMSPAAKMSGEIVRSDSSVRTPSCTSSPAAKGNVHIGPDTDPDDYDIGRQPGAVAQLDGLDPTGPVELAHGSAGDDPHAIGLMQSHEDAGDVPAEHALQRLSCRLNHA